MDGKKGSTFKIFNPNTAAGAGILAAFLLVLCSSDIAIEYMKKGLRLCAATVIPALFPFMIISELIVSSGIGIRVSKIFAKPMRYIFGIGESGAAVYFLGAICGFPIGAKAAASMYDRGDISKSELERLLTFCNNPGSAFVISAVGVSLLGSKKLGILLYVCVILSSLAVGALGKLFMKKEKTEKIYHIPCKGCHFASSVTNAIQASALSMLSVCAYVVFFSAFIGCVGALLAHFSLPDELIASIFGFFELSSGASAASALDGNIERIILCALFLGWSGLSVHFQIMSVCANRDVSFKPYFVSKAVQGVLCAAFAYISVKLLFPSLLTDDLTVYLQKDDLSLGVLTLIFHALFAVTVICAGVKMLYSGKFFKNIREKIKKRY